ncbi:MAG: glycerophosphodiester phosphodiesterase [Burkholderiales bacterium]
MPRPWPYPRVIGHRGGGALAPENTLAGIRKAAQLGFGADEFDVVLSADKVPLLMHDETLERTTGGRGAVARARYADIASLDAGARFGDEYRGERVPSFELAARLCIELRLWANVEIKPTTGFERETGSATAKLARELWRGATPTPLLSSFQRSALESARSVAPEFDRGYLTERIEPGWREAAEALGCVSVHCDSRHLTQAQAGEIRRSGYWLLCYTVNDPEVAGRIFSWGVNAIFTDRLDLIPPDFS